VWDPRYSTGDGWTRQNSFHISRYCRQLRDSSES